MSRVKDFKLPDLGEGLTEGEILQWMVGPGDTITLNQPIVEVETAKAAVEVPSPYAGTVVRLHHAAGAVVDVGAVIISVDTDPSAGPLPDPALGATDLVPTPESGSSEPPGKEGALIGEVGANGRTATLVGYGPRSGTAKRRARTDASVTTTTTSAAEPPPVPARVSAAAVGQSAAAKLAERPERGPVRAKPPVRKLAKDLGVDLADVIATGPDETLTREDVLAAHGAAEQGAGAARQVAPGYDAATREQRQVVKGVRKMTAQAMVGSAFTAPHVTEFITVDVTPTMDLLARLKGSREFDGVKLTPLVLIARALLLAIRRNPEINSTWVDEADGAVIVTKEYVHLGIAAATPRGLLVPNLKDADRMTLRELALALAELTETARAGKTAPADMQQGTITITNVGVFGVDTGTPILNPGEAAILCLGVIRPTPWVHQGQIAIRQVTTLALSFDHRVVDGQLGSQVLADLAAVLSDPGVALAWA